MKFLVLGVLTFVLLACNATNQTKDDEISLANPNQHIAMAANVAYFYCENGRWPKDLDELESYSTQKALPLPAKLDFSFIRDVRSTFTITDVVYLRIPENVVEQGGFAVSSTSKPPKCEGKNVITDFHMNIGD